MRKLIITGLLSIFFLQSCGNGGNGDEQPEGPPGGGGQDDGAAVEVAEVTTDRITDQIRSYGSVSSQDVVQVIPELNERITEIHVDLGDSVSEGDLLARLYDATYRDEVRSDEASLRQMQTTLARDSTTYERQRQLYERDAISRSEYDEARSDYESTRADFESVEASHTQSKENLRRTEVRSPVDGVVERRNQSRGDLASTGQELFEVATTSGYEVRLHIPMNEWRRTAINQNVHLRPSGDDEFNGDGIITRRSPNIDRNTGLGEVVVTVTDPGPSILSGALAESRIDVENRENTVVVSRDALSEQVQTRINPETNTIDIEREYSAFVAQGDTLADLRTLELGIEQGNNVEILEGLSAGDKLIIRGQDGLEDQTPIRITRGDPLEEEEGMPVDEDDAGEETEAPETE